MKKQYKTIDELIHDKGKKMNYIAEHLGVSGVTFRKFRSNPELLSVEQAVKLSYALDVDLQVVIDTILKQEFDKLNNE